MQSPVIFSNNNTGNKEPNIVQTMPKKGVVDLFLENPRATTVATILSTILAASSVMHHSTLSNIEGICSNQSAIAMDDKLNPNLTEIERKQTTRSSYKFLNGYCYRNIGFFEGVKLFLLPIENTPSIVVPKTSTDKEWDEDVLFLVARNYYTGIFLSVFSIYFLVWVSTSI